MILYFLGLPGSGKSYYGVYTIYNNFSNDKEAKRDLKKDYQVCYTNINEFKFDKLENVYPFDEDEFFKKLEILYDMYKKKASDDELIEKCKDFNIYKALFVLDECHKFFDVQKPVLVWWLTYHRHLYHDLILITQSLSLVNPKYKPLAEAFYKAKSSSLTFNKKYFNYMYYTDSRMSKSSYVTAIKVKKNPKVFDLYHSGDSVNSKNVIKRFLLISLFLFLLLISMIFFFSSSKKSQIEEEKSTLPFNSKQLSVSYQDNNDDSSTFDNKKLIVLKCSYSTCSNDYISLPPQLVKKFIDMELLHLYYKDSVNKYLTVFYLSSSEDFFNFLNSTKGNNNEENFSHDDINIFGNSK